MLTSTSYILGGFDLVKEKGKRILRIGDCSGSLRWIGLYCVKQEEAHVGKSSIYKGSSG